MSDNALQFRRTFSVYIDYGSIIYDDDNFVKLDKSETFRFDYDFVCTFIKTYLFSMVIGTIGAVFLLGFLPNLTQVMLQGYHYQIVIDFAVQHTINDFIPRPSAVMEIPKAWLIPVAGLIFSTVLRRFYVCD